MFDLEHEVEAWTRNVYADSCGSTASVAELRDHLHCEIDRARGEGLSDEQAFAAAVAKLGPAPQLAAEIAKNRSLLEAGCAVAARFDRVPSSGTNRGLLLAHAVLWATMMIATALMMKGGGAPVTFQWLLLVIFIPTWIASEQLLKRAMRQRPGRGAQ